MLPRNNICDLAIQTADSSSLTFLFWALGVKCIFRLISAQFLKFMNYLCAVAPYMSILRRVGIIDVEDQRKRELGLA